MHSGLASADAANTLQVRLRTLGYEFDLPDAHREPSPKTIRLSFDDNFAEWLPIGEKLARLGIPALFYVNSIALRDRASNKDIEEYYARLGQKAACTPLSSRELLALEAMGHRVGCHGHAHPNLAAIPRDVAEADICLGKRTLEELLGHEVVDFAFPYGMRCHFNGDLDAYCRRIGFETIATGIGGMLHGHRNDRIYHRTPWLNSRPFEWNFENLMISNRWFHALTGRTLIGFSEWV